MKLTMKNMMENYAAKREEMILAGKEIKLSTMDNCKELVGDFTKADSLVKRIDLILEDNSLISIYDTIALQVQKDFPTEKRVNILTAICAGLLEKLYNKNNVGSNEEAAITIAEPLTDKVLYVKAIGFGPCTNRLLGSNLMIYESTSVSVTTNELRYFMNRLVGMVEQAHNNGFQTIATGHENIDSTNTFIFYLSKAVQVFNIRNKQNMKFVVYRGKECTVRLGINLDHCVTGKFNSSAAVIQKHGENFRKITEVLNDARQARTFKVYKNEILVDGSRIPLQPYLREMDYRSAGLSNEGLKRASSFAIPLVSVNYANNINKHIVKNPSLTTLQMIKAANIDSCVYIGSQPGYNKTILEKNTNLKHFSFYSWEDMLRSKEPEYKDADIVSDGLPLK